MLELDHVVYCSDASPVENVNNYDHTVVGGQHKQWGTSNALMYTRNSYIEYLSVHDKECAAKSTHPLPTLLLHDLKHGAGWGTICFRTNDIDALNKRFIIDGWQTSGVINAERETSSGFTRRWKMLFIDQEVSKELPYPFFIQWEESLENRMKSLKEDGTITRENEKLTIRRCDFAVKDPDKTVERWSKLLSLVPSVSTLKLSNTELHFLKSSKNYDRLSNVYVEKFE